MNIDPWESIIDCEVTRTGLATALFSILRPHHAKAVSIVADAIQLEYRSRFSNIPFCNIDSALVKTGWFWSKVWLRYDDKEVVVSGLPPADARSFIQTLETARIQWWRRTLESKINILRPIHDKLTQLDNPHAYLKCSFFNKLKTEAENAAGQFTTCWPDTLSDEPEIQMLKTILDFLKKPDQVREKANTIFVKNELLRSKELFDQIENRALTDEQRKSVVSDDDRNIVIAAAGSGKTSVIVAKAGWLLNRSYRQPAELLLLAFARDARNEMEERIRNRIGVRKANEITVSTFHSLGYAIIGEVEGKRPAISKAVENNRALTDLVKGIIYELVADQTISENVLTWFREQFAPYQSLHEFKSWGEYYDYIRRYEIRSLKGEQLKSFEECEIANFLYLNGINYKYEHLYEYETATSEKGPYRPDFYLPEFEIWIEHFGLNAKNETAPFVPQKAYLESMAWKRTLHEEHGTTLIETFSHECAAGTLLRNLEKKLHACGVNLSPIPTSEVFTTLQEQGWIDPFINLLTTFLQHFKGAQLSFEQVMQRAANMENRARAEAFLVVFKLVFERYQYELERSGEIDYYDMITKAAEHVESGRYRSSFGYILVDEFQDISPDRARLLKALLNHSSDNQLFAVGDDWQAIFRFAGSDCSIMRNFTEHFGASKQLSLETTFRCNDRIATTATDFILKNPAQISKTVRSVHRADKPCVHVGLSGGQKLSLLKEALDRIAKNARSYNVDSSVLLLGRYRHLRPQNLSSLARQYPGLHFTYKTVHRSKGLEADYVVVLNVCSGNYGFPTEITDDALLDLIFATSESHSNAEERRLLYVAITRAKRQAFLLAEGGPPSSFAIELTGDDYDTKTFGRSPERDVSCPLCIEGRIVRRKNKNNDSIFFGCSNYPYCEHRQQPCPVCREGLLVRGLEKFKCQDCGQSIEACPKCDGWLQIRMGKYGRFLGCTSFPACKFTRKIEFRDKKMNR